MGSGKTTFGKKLAAKFGLQFIDLDEAIVLHNKLKTGEVKTIAQIISKEGFDYFRKAESETLRSLDLENKVVATGGGTPCYFDNMRWMKENGTVVFLEIEEKILFSRLKKTDLSQRPLLKDFDEEGLKNFISEKLSERLQTYLQAHIVFNPVRSKTAFGF